MANENTSPVLSGSDPAGALGQTDSFVFNDTDPARRLADGTDGAVAPEIIDVHDAAGLKAALAAATGGEVIRLAAGDYGRISIDGAYAETVTILSDPDAPAVFHGVSIRGARNVAIDGAVMDYRFEPGEGSIHDRDFKIRDSEDITLRNIHFDGDDASGTGTPDDGAGAGHGLYVKDSRGVTVENSLFEGFYRGAVFSSSDDITFSGNEVTDIRSDGLNLFATQGAAVTGNYFHDFREAVGSKDHKDMIQVFSFNADRPTTDLVISHNTFDIGEGAATQTIFMGNEAVAAQGAGAEMFYADITIEENFIRNSHVHGIAVGATENLSVQNNTLVLGPPSDNGGAGWPRIDIDTRSTGVSVASNIADGIDRLDAAAGWSVGNNLDPQADNPNGAGYTGAIFVNPDTSAAGQASGFQLLADGAAVEAGQGASWMVYDGTQESLTALVRQDAGEARNQISLDASLSADPAGTAEAGGARFLWDFGDGTSGEGVRMTHVYDDPGRYDITLTVEMPDGRRDTASLRAEIASPDVVGFDNEAGAMLLQRMGEERALDIDLPLVDLGDGHRAIQLGGGDDGHVDLPRGALGALWGAEGFRMTASLRMEDGSRDAGMLAKVHSSFSVNITTSGEMVLKLTPGGSDSEIRVATEGARLIDGNWHDLDISWNGESGALTLGVDGIVLGETQLVGRLQPQEHWGLTLGNAWGGNFTGQIGAFDLDAEPQNYIAAAPAAPEAIETPGPEKILFDPGLMGDTLDIILDADAGDAPVRLTPLSEAQSLGRTEAFEASDQIAFKVDFERLSDGGGYNELVWNHMRAGLSLAGEHLTVHVGTAEGGMARIRSENVGLKTAGAHEAVVMIDAEADVMKLFLDGELLLENHDVDMEVAGPGWQHGWSVGVPWRDVRFDDFDVEVSGVEVADFSDMAQDFIDTPLA